MDRADRHWKSQPSLIGAPPWLRPWLGDKASLTARIAARCKRFEVRVLRQGRALPNHDERALIGLPRSRHAWLREVLLLADGVPVVFAHTVLAPQHLRGAWRMAAAIGGRPLGAALFAEPRIVRGELSCERIGAAHALHRRAAKALGMPLPALWARRSRFMRRSAPLLVTEVFLPGLTAPGRELSRNPGR